MSYQISSRNVERFAAHLYIKDLYAPDLDMLPFGNTSDHPLHRTPLFTHDFSSAANCDYRFFFHILFGAFTKVNRFDRRFLQEFLGALNAQVGLFFVRHVSLCVAYVTKDHH
jgi:hypothetical protein